MAAIRNFLEAVKRDMIKEQRNKGIPASGRSRDSLTITGSRTRGAVLEGVGYWSFLFSGQGTGPGSFPPPLNMFKWIKQKGIKFIDFATGRFMSDKRAAFLAGQKIKREGTEIFKNPSKGVNIDTIINRHIDKMGEDLATDIQQKFIKEIDKVIIG